jgi:two-component system, cell cycle sensor histidine kinase and response regulator CckA
MILVVDDEAGVRQFVSAALAQRGYTVVQASSAEEAWGILEKSRPELLITDIVMPGGNGVQLAARAHKLQPQLRAIFITGYADQFRDELGSSVCLSKPFTTTSLLFAVESAIGPPGTKAAG